MRLKVCKWTGGWMARASRAANEQAFVRPCEARLLGCHGVGEVGLPSTAERLERGDRREGGFGLRLRLRIGGAQQVLVGLQDLDQADDAPLIGCKRSAASAPKRVDALSQYGRLLFALDERREGVLDVLGRAQR